MTKSYTVCLTFDYEKCKAVTSELAKRNDAIDYVIEPVAVKPSLQFAYRGRIIKEESE